MWTYCKDYLEVVRFTHIVEWKYSHPKIYYNCRKITSKCVLGWKIIGEIS